MAAAGAGVDRWLPCRGRRSQFRGDRFHRTHARAGPVPGSTDFLFDGIHAARTDAGRRACFTPRFLLSERAIVSGHISIGERSRILIGAFVQVADRIRIPEAIPVHLPDPDPDSFHVVPVPDPDPVGLGLPDPDFDPFLVHVFACIHADEHTSGRIGTRIRIGIGVAERMPGGEALSCGPWAAVR